MVLPLIRKVQQQDAHSVGLDGATSTVTKTATATATATELTLADYIVLAGTRGCSVLSNFRTRAMTTRAGSTAATVTVGVLAI
jgi:hypothetical protein